MLGLADEVLEQLRPYCARAQGAGLGALAGAGQAGPHTMRFTNQPCRARAAGSSVHKEARSGAVTGRRGYPPRLRNGSPRRQAVTLWYPPRTIENESRFPGKAAGRGVGRECLSGSLASPLPVRSPLPPPPHRRARARPRSTLHVHTLHTTTAAPLHTHKASHGARGGCGGADAAVAAAPTSADGGPWGRLGNCTAPSESAESVVAATAGSAAAAESVAGRQTARARLLRAQRTPERQPLVCSWRLEVL